ncbi:MAG: hypothetical protein GXZ08_05165 [Tissierellia bacterium]|nr:hypothetical protein [Tissierellia bacterium]
MKIKTEEKRYLLVSLLMAVFITIMTPNIISANRTVEVNTVIELVDAVNSAQEGDNIYLSDTFVFNDFNVETPKVNVTIDGGGKVWNNGATVITGNNKGSITIKNIKYDGASIDDNVITINTENGKTILENVEIYNSQKGAMKIETSVDTSIELNRVFIHDNTATNTAPAISLGEFANVDINNSTISNNIGNGGGDATGAISSKNYRGNLNINNSVFRKNTNNSFNTGTLGGGGGAIAFHYLRGNLKIIESIFDGNSSSHNISKTSDGGAIYILDGRDGATVDIKSSTFSNNIAYDDGGAIMFQVTGNPGLTTTITNSTFYNNKAYGLANDDYAGGAIQYFKNGGSSKYVNTILSSTFFRNTSGSEKSTTEQRGGAIGLSGAGTFATAAVTRNNSLFVGNSVYGADGKINEVSNYKDLSNYTTVQEGKANVINVDKGATPKYSIKEVMGVDKPFLSENQSNIVAGYKDEIVKTLPIKPEGIADNSYSGTAKVPDNDQRGSSRYKDQGAVEMSWIKYHSNKGVYEIKELPKYVGEQYYVTNNKYSIIEYYTIGNIGGTTSIPNAESIGLVNNEGKKFKGWSTDREAEKPDEKYAVGKDINYSEDNLILYAVWADEEFSIDYYPNGSTSGEAPTDSNSPYKKGTQVKILDGNDLEKSGYMFVGWNTEANGSGIDHAVDSTFEITEDTTLYASWRIPFSVIYDGNGESSGSVRDENEYAPDASVTVLSNEDGFVKAHHEFIGWQDGTGEDYPVGSTFKITENTTLYAQWKEDANFRITYHKNGGGGKVPVDNNKYYENMEAIILDGDELVRENYEFIGWNTKADGSGTHYDCWDEITVNEDITLYAEWKEIERVTIKYDGNGHTSGNPPVDGDSPYIYDTEITILDIMDMEKEGHRFIAWNVEPDGSGMFYRPNDTANLTFNATLYAIWYKEELPVDGKYSVTYDGNGSTSGTVPMDNREYSLDDEVYLEGNPGNLNKEGYKFVGWSLSRDGNRINSFQIKRDTTVYAIWEKSESDMSFLIWNWNEDSFDNGITLDVYEHKAYINGYPDGRIMPEGEITRGEVAAIIARLHADVVELEYDVRTSYSDVNDSDWYSKYISYVSDKGLMEGYEDETFKPQEKITRGEYATVIARFKGLEKSETYFEDSKDHWASGSIGAVYLKEWISGYPDGTFKPMNNITRAEVASMTNKMLDRSVNNEGLHDASINKFIDLEYGSWYYFDMVEASNTHSYIRQSENSIMENWK